MYIIVPQCTKNGQENSNKNSAAESQSTTKYECNKRIKTSLKVTCIQKKKKIFI